MKHKRRPSRTLHSRPSSRIHSKNKTAAPERSPFRKVYVNVRKAIVFLEEDPFVRAFMGLVVLFTFLQLSVDLFDRRDERAFRLEERGFRQEERISRSWSLLLNPSSSNTIKVRAIETLYEGGVSFRGIDLSCETLGGGWDEELLLCKRPLDLTGLRINAPAAKGWRMVSVDKDEAGQIVHPSAWTNSCLAKDFFDEASSIDKPTFLGTPNVGTQLQLNFDRQRMELRQGGADFRDALLSGVDFSDAQISGGSFVGADMRGAYFEGASLEAADFRDTRLENAEFRSSYLSGATFGELPQEMRRRRQDQAFANRQFLDIMRDKTWDVVISGSFANGAVFQSKLYDQAQFKFFGTALVNSDLNLSLQASAFELGECDKRRAQNSHNPALNGCLPKQSIRRDIARSNMRCAVVRKDHGLGLVDSNISSAYFPPRLLIGEGSQKWPGGDSSDKISSSNYTTYEHSSFIVQSSGWSGPIVQPPWAWSDQPPFTNLAGEVVYKCDAAERAKSKGLLQDATASQECSIGGFRGSVFEFPEPSVLPEPVFSPE